MILEKALRRDSIYASSDFDEVMPEISRALLQIDSLEIVSWLNSIQKEQTPNLQYTKRVLLAETIIRLTYKGLPRITTLDKLDEYKYMLSTAIAAKESEVIRSDRDNTIISKGKKAMNRLEDRRTEILSGNLYHSNLFVSDNIYQ